MVKRKSKISPSERRKYHSALRTLKNNGFNPRRAELKNPKKLMRLAKDLKKLARFAENRELP